MKNSKLVEIFAGIAEHKPSTAIGASIIAYEVISKMATPEVMDVVNTVVGLFAAAAFSLYKGKK